MTRPSGATTSAASASVSSLPTKSRTTSAGRPSAAVAAAHRIEQAHVGPELGRALQPRGRPLADDDEELAPYRGQPQVLERELAEAAAPTTSTRAPAASHGRLAGPPGTG